jgi:hypothetical protein
VIAGLVIAAFLRFGFLPLAVGFGLSRLFSAIPLTFDLTRWYAETTVLAFLVFAGVLGWGLLASSGGRPLFRQELLDG